MAMDPSDLVLSLNGNSTSRSFKTHDNEDPLLSTLSRLGKDTSIKKQGPAYQQGTTSSSNRTKYHDVKGVVHLNSSASSSNNHNNISKQLQQRSPVNNHLINQLRELNLKKLANKSITSNSQPGSCTSRTHVSKTYFTKTGKENNSMIVNQHKKTMSSDMSNSHVSGKIANPNGGITHTESSKDLGLNQTKKNKELISKIQLPSKRVAETTDKTVKPIQSTKPTSKILVASNTSQTTIKTNLQLLKPVKQQFTKIPVDERMRIDHFELGRKLGKGRFGNVYMAQHRKSKMLLAIKIVNKKLLKESGMQNQLAEEIKLQMYMNHPNILKMYGYFADETNIYMLLELGTGCLFKELRQKTKFDEQTTVFYIKQVIEALKYMHSEHIIHRDIKPENILITNGVLKLSDFGWSTYSPTNKRQTFCGTLDYVPPEIVEGEYYDEKVDIWSLGVLCYELTTGKAPFEVGNDQQRTYNKILSVQINYPSYLSPELCDLLTKILIKDPGERLKLCEIQRHPWLQKHSTYGRYIMKEVWESWDSFK